MKELFVLCEKGDGQVNEDVCGMCSSFAWVIDGATDVFFRKALFPCNEVNRYVNALNERIKQYAPSYQPEQLQELLSDAIASLYVELNSGGQLTNIAEYEMPTFTVAMVSVSADVLRYLVIGDCFISYLSDCGIQMITDTRITRFSQYNRNMLKAHYTISNSPVDMQKVYQATRKNANQPDGYPIGSVRGSGIIHAVTGKIQLQPHERFLICSDGFLDYYRDNSADNLRFFNPDTIQLEILKMKQFLEDDFQFRLAPRPKKKDDCTIMLLEV